MLREESVQRPSSRNFEMFKDSKCRLAKMKGTPIGLGNTRLEKLLKEVL